MSVVLIVEDEPDMRFLLRLTLERGDVTVIDADTGELALELMTDSRPDVVLLDLNLPGIDGFEVVSKMSEDDGLAEVPIVLLTADARPHVMERAQELGCFAFLSKPIPPDVLMAKVTAAIASTGNGEGAESIAKP
jgi:CheY-like chemotaxis protein